MSRKTSILSVVVTYSVTIGLFILVVLMGQKYFANFWSIVFLMIAGAILAGVIVTFFHEFGHVLGGKINGFEFVSMSVLFFKWVKVKGKISFIFSGLGGELGYTEMIPKYPENMAKRYKSMTLCGVLFGIIPTLIGVIPLFLTTLPAWLYCLWVTLLPVGIYYILDNGLPTMGAGVPNDGGNIYLISKKRDTAKVMINLLTIQAEMYQGKTPSEIDEKLYFDLPQLREDDLNYFFLLNARYNYYLDKKDYDKAKETTERILSLEEYSFEQYKHVAKADALYNACTFDYNEDVADDLTYEVENYLNSDNNCTNLRIKMAYILFVLKEKDAFESFYNKIKKEASRCQIKGLGRFELNNLEAIKQIYLEKFKN